MGGAAAPPFFCAVNLGGGKGGRERDKNKKYQKPQPETPAAEPLGTVEGKNQGRSKKEMKTRVEINQQLLDNQRDALRACMTVDGEMGKRLREAIFEELKRARNSIMESIRFDNGDPRGTAHAVKRYVASKYLGGVVSIANYKTKASGMKSIYEPPRTLQPGQRGGNRMIRSERTQTMLSYGPQDRGFILNWLNSGTRIRYSGYGRNGKTASAYDKFVERNGGKGFRNQIAPMNFFRRLGEPALEKAMEKLSKIVDEEFSKLIKE